MARAPYTQHWIQTLMESHHTLTATGILEALQQQGHAVNKTTVYRAIEKLVERGVLCSHFFAGSTVHYELATHHHDHMVCQCCGSVASVRVAAQIQGKLNGFQPEHQHVTIFGRCRKCPDTPHTHSEIS